MSSVNTGVGLSVFLLLVYNCTARYRKQILDEEVDVTNEVFVPEFEMIPSLSGIHRTSKILESNIIPEIKSLTPSEIMEELKSRIKNSGYSPYFLDDLLLQISLKSIYGQRLINVTLYEGIVTGLADFRHHIEDVQSLTKNSFEILVIWNRIRVHYKVIVDRDGLKNTGELDVEISRLYMIVHLKRSDSRIPKIEMSKVGDFKVKLHGFDDLSDELKTSISKETKHKIRAIFNDKIRNTLLKNVKDILTESTEENMLSSLMYSINGVNH